jgi:ferric-dicitrate binding protein FerR (iron transport regulator)
MDDELLFRIMTARSAPRDQAWITAWAAVSPESVERLRDVADLLRLTAAADGRLDFGPPPTGEEMLIGRRYRGPAAVTNSRRMRVAFLAAAVLVGIWFTIPAAQRLWNREATGVAASFGPDEFTTEAEPATLGLRDGTVIRLAPSSRLRVHELGSAREISLAGRGYFAVAPDADAPFKVHSDAGTVTVLGTRFDLAVSGDDLRLIVIEGRVRLTVRGATVEVRAGQLARVIKGNLAPPIEVPDPESLVGWVGDIIVIQDTPLHNAKREIERRHGVRIEFADPQLGDRTVTALYAGRSLEEIAEVVCLIAQLHCVREGDLLRMAPAH